MSTALAKVVARFREVNGDHPMSLADDAYVREHFEPVTEEATLEQMAARRLPLPSYLLPDGTPMAPADLLDPVSWAGGVDRLPDWFRAHWEPEESERAEEEWRAYLSGRYVCLRSVTPVAIRRKVELVAQIETALRRLAVAPRDGVARGSLHEAVEALDRLELPMTDYDRLRFGGPTSRDVWIDDVRRDHLSPPADPPLPIRTERLLLRRQEHRDADDLHAIYGRADVARYLLKPALGRLEWEQHQRDRAASAETAFGLVAELDGRVVGEVVLIFRGPAQAETGWTFHPDLAGRGLATEASRAVIDLGFTHFGFMRIYAELDARNTASARLCERLGMRRESHRLADFWSKGEWTDTLQYAVLATEWPTPGPRVRQGAP